MNIVRCAAGHFFDTHRYEQCPFCASGQAAAQLPETAPQTTEADFVTLPGCAVDPDSLTVGWLVAIEGAAMGTDHVLRTGYNYITPSAEGLTICSQAEPGQAAVIGYDDLHGAFSVAPRGGTRALRVNGTMILEAVGLKAYDRIAIGGRNYLFVPLCGPQFSWADNARR